LQKYNNTNKKLLKKYIEKKVIVNFKQIACD